MGRPVRCTGCRKPFILRENGQAEKVEERPKTTSIHSATPRRSVSEQIAVEVKRQSGADREESDEYAPHSKAVANDRTDSELFPATASVDHQTDAAISRKGEGTDSQSARSRSSARLNAKQQRTRRIMAKNLSEAATMALTKVSERTEAVQRKASDRLGSDRITRKGHAGKASDGTELGPAILTGEGNRSPIIPTWLKFTIAGFVALMVVWFVWPVAPESRILYQFGGGVVSFTAGTMGDLPEEKQRLIISGGEVSPLSSLDDHELGSIRSYNLSQLLGDISEMAPVGETGIWLNRQLLPDAQVVYEQAEAAHNEWVVEVKRIQAAIEASEDTGLEEDLIIPDEPPSQVEALRLMKDWKLLSDEDISSELAKIPEVGDMLNAIFKLADSFLRSSFVSGNIPQEFTTRPFYGNNALWHVGFGNPEKVPFEGQLVRFDSQEWKLFALKVRTR